MFVLQESVNTGAIDASGWFVLLACLAITVAWLYYVYR